MSYDSQRKVSAKKQKFKDEVQWTNDQAWAHWDYSSEEWAVFDRVDWQAVRIRYWLPNLALLVCNIILDIVFFQTTLSIVFLVLGLSIVAIVFMIRGYSYQEAKKRHQARLNQTQPQRVTFSKDGVWEAGTHFPFMALQRVHMTSQPAVLHFRRKHHVYFSDGNGNNRYDTLRVLVPHGREAEATRLMERFRARISELNKPGTFNPPEPV